MPVDLVLQLVVGGHPHAGLVANLIVMVGLGAGLAWVVAILIYAFCVWMAE